MKSICWISNEDPRESRYMVSHNLLWISSDGFHESNQPLRESVGAQ